MPISQLVTLLARTGVGEVRNTAGEIHVAFLRSEHRPRMICLLRDREHLAQPDDSVASLIEAGRGISIQS
jgi:hypothetical protein